MWRLYLRYHHKLGEVYFLSFAFLAIGAGSSLAQNTVAQQVLPIVKIQQSNCTFPSPLPISTCTSNAYVVGSDGGVSKCAASMQAAFDKAKGKWIITKPASGTCNYLFKANGAATGPFSVDLDIDAPFKPSLQSINMDCVANIGPNCQQCNGLSHVFCWRHRGHA